MQACMRILGHHHHLPYSTGHFFSVLRTGLYASSPVPHKRHGNGNGLMVKLIFNATSPGCYISLPLAPSPSPLPPHAGTRTQTRTRARARTHVRARARAGMCARAYSHVDTHVRAHTHAPPTYRSTQVSVYVFSIHFLYIVVCGQWTVERRLRVGCGHLHNYI